MSNHRGVLVSVSGMQLLRFLHGCVAQMWLVLAQAELTA